LRYFRLHGIGGYRHRYTAEELERLHLLPPKEALTCCLFNNVSMFEDARRFQEALAASR
jgi:uncharacterized protein YecE (DUF72 family)